MMRMINTRDSLTSMEELGGVRRIYPSLSTLDDRIHIISLLFPIQHVRVTVTPPRPGPVPIMMSLTRSELIITT